MIKKIFLSLVIIFILASGAFAEPENDKKDKAEEEDFLTKGEAAVLISATDFMRQKIGALLSWTIGYDITKVNRARLVPIIDYVLAVPKAVPPDGRTIVEIKASVNDPSGLKNISGVRADLTDLGKLSNMMLVDNGLWGDEIANDGIYTLQTSVGPKVEVGGKEIAVAVANKKGWLTLAKTSLNVEKNPKVLEGQAIPNRIIKDQPTTILLKIKVDNPGRVEDLEKVLVDLSPLGGSRSVPLQLDTAEGEDIFTAKVKVSGKISIGNQKLLVRATNKVGGVGLGEIHIKVVGE